MQNIFSKMHDHKNQISILCIKYTALLEDKFCHKRMHFLVSNFQALSIQRPQTPLLTFTEPPPFVNFFDTDLSANLGGYSQMIACIIQYLIQYNVIFSESISDDSNLLTWGHKL